MAKVPVTLSHDAVLSPDEAEQLSFGQAHWWLRSAEDFVRLPRRVRGDEPLDLIVHLDPGRYILGVGPPRTGVRIDLDVVAPAATPSATAETTAPPIDLSGKAFVLTGDLDAMDRDTAAAWLKERGARVTTSVSAKTDYLVVGREPGQKKLEKAAELGIAQLDEPGLRTQFGFPAPGNVTVTATPSTSPALATAASKEEKVSKMLGRLKEGEPHPKVAKLIGPSHFADLGLTDDELWGIAIGPQGGSYRVHIDLNDRPRYAVRCNCTNRNPCQHGLALLFTALRHFIPPAPAPEGHREASRYVATWE